MKKSNGLVVPKWEPRGTVPEKIPMLQQVPGGWVVFKYDLTPKLGYEGKVLPLFWQGPGSRGWKGTHGGELPAEAKVFDTGDEARAAMRVAGIPIRAGDDIEQASLW